MSLITERDYRATTAVPMIIKGSGVSNRHLTKKQRAALAAEILAGNAILKPTAGQLATIFGVSVSYIEAAAPLNGSTATPPAPMASRPPQEALSVFIRRVGIDGAMRAAAEGRA